MTRPRITFQPGDEILSEIADLLIEQNRLLGDIRDRLPEPTRAGQPDPVEVSEPLPAKRSAGRGEGGPVPVTEPAPPPAPTEARPVTEPAPKRKQRRDSDDGMAVPPPPPRSGKGSGIEAWRSFASLAQVPVPDGASRDDIIAACVNAKVIDSEYE